MLKIIIFMVLYLLVGCIVSLLTYLYTEDDELIGVSVILWPLIPIIAAFYVVCTFIEELGDYINKKREDKEDE